MNDREIIKSFSLKLRANSVESGPPLSTILGNFIINAVKFSKEFNEYTGDLQNYFLLEVKVNIFSDRTYSFSVMEPSTTFLLRLISFNKDIKVIGSGGFKTQVIQVVKLVDIYLISKIKYGVVNNRTLATLYGTICSMDLYVVK